MHAVIIYSFYAKTPIRSGEPLQRCVKVYICFFLETKNLDSFVQGLELLGTGRSSGLAERHLGNELPVGRDLELGLRLELADSLIVLESGTVTLLLQGGPDDKLDH